MGGVGTTAQVVERRGTVRKSTQLPQLCALAVWYTRAAERECYNRHMDYGVPLGVHLAQQTGITVLFDDPDFWSLALSLRANPTDQTIADELAEVVQASGGFFRLAEMLRTDPQSAVRVLPTKSARPARFARPVSS